MELIALGIAVLLVFGAIRIVGTVLSSLTGSNYRSYRALASKYGGQVESRGMIDPPTVSFVYNQSNVRVGLAPVVAGQPAPPRTRIVTRFRDGQPLRLEVFPITRPAPPQLPRGTQQVALGQADFDRHFVMRANDLELARAFLGSAQALRPLDTLRRLGGPSGMILSVSPERLLVQVDRNLPQNATQFDQAVRETLILHDLLQTAIDVHIGDGVQVLEEAPANPEETGPAECKVCGEAIQGPHVRCASCKTPCHRDCWTYIGQCSIFGCQCRQFVNVS